MKNKINNYPSVRKLCLKSDYRGWFAELLRSDDVNKSNSKNGFGQISITGANPHQEKGGHYHKIRHEWFIVLSGSIKFKLKNIVTGRKRRIFLHDSSLKCLYIPPHWFHSLENISDKEATILLYSSIVFNTDFPDVYAK